MDPELFAEAVKIEEQVKAISRCTRTPYGVAAAIVQFDKEPAVDIKKRLIDAHPELPGMVSRVFYGEPVEDSCHAVISSAMKSHFKLPVCEFWQFPHFGCFSDNRLGERLERECTYSTPGIAGDLISQLATFSNIMRMSEGYFFPYQAHELPFDVLDCIPSTPEVKRCAVQLWEILDLYFLKSRNDSVAQAMMDDFVFELDEACREALQQMLSVHTKSASKRS
jgi:hypothetical protein